MAHSAKKPATPKMIAVPKTPKDKSLDRQADRVVTRISTPKKPR